jgi:hypothetical protein
VTIIDPVGAGFVESLARPEDGGMRNRFPVQGHPTAPTGVHPRSGPQTCFRGRAISSRSASRTSRTRRVLATSCGRVRRPDQNSHPGRAPGGPGFPPGVFSAALFYEGAPLCPGDHGNPLGHTKRVTAAVTSFPPVTKMTSPLNGRDSDISADYRSARALKSAA